MAIISTGPVGTPSYLSSAYGRVAVLADPGSGGANGQDAPSSSSAATVVTISAAAQARLAQGTIGDLATVTTDARAALDALYRAAKVSGPLAADGTPAVDLSSLDRRALYAVATNGGGKFTADEQQAATSELKTRFDAVLSPQAAVARLTGDWSQIYKAALDYVQGAGPEEKASTAFQAQVAALQQGLAAVTAAPGKLPQANPDDPVAAFLATSAGSDGASQNGQDISAVADDVRTALDAQKKAAADKGLELVFDPARKTGQLVDLSGFDNRSLSAVALDTGNQFSAEEVHAAKAELSSRTRTAMLAAFKQAGGSSDPHAFSLGLIYTYTQMSTEERQAMNFTPAFRDLAVQNYQSTSNLISMLQQSSGDLSALFG